MVKCDKSPIAPPSLAQEKRKGKNGSYNKADVVMQLIHDFHGKCYICELKSPSDIEVEHLVPKANDGPDDVTLQFDWNNLFLSCPHCNRVKNRQEFNGTIIDCCITDPEIHVLFQYGTDDVIVTPLDNDISSERTATLVYDVFNLKNSGIRIYASQYRLDKLKEEMNVFFKALLKYDRSKSLFQRRKVEALLRRSSAFAAFKRSYVRNNPKYPEFQQVVQL